MKKVISLLLIILMLFSLVIPTYGAKSFKMGGQLYQGKYDPWDPKHNALVQNYNYPSDEEREETIKRAFQLFRGAGLTPEGAAGVLGNLISESNGCTGLLEYAYESSWSRYGKDKCWQAQMEDWEKGTTSGFGLFGFTSASAVFSVFDAAAEAGVTCFDVDAQIMAGISKYEGALEDGGYDPSMFKTPPSGLSGEKYIKACAWAFLGGYERDWALGVVGHTLTRQMAKTGVLAFSAGQYYHSQYGDPITDYNKRAAQAIDVYNKYKDLPGIKPGGGVVKDSSSGKSSGGSSSIKEEWEVVGFKNPMAGKSDNLYQMNRSDLSTTDAYQIVNIGDNMELQNSINLWDTARIFLVFIGMLLLVYSTLLGLAMAADNVRIFAQFSVVELVSLGSIHYAGSDKDYLEEKTKRKYKSNGGMIAIIIIVFLFGLLLVSGAVLPAVMKAVAKITGMFGAM